MKAHLLYPDADFDLKADLAPGHGDLVQDLELSTVLTAMAGDDKFRRDVSARVLLTSCTDPAVIRYRQQILADCISHPDVIRQMYNTSVSTLREKRRVWGFLSSRNPSTILSAAVNQLDVLITGLRQLRRLADENADAFQSAGLTALFDSLQRDLDDEYFETLAQHLRQLRFTGGVPISAELDRDNSGINYVLRSGSTRRGWKELVGIEARSVYSFTLHPRDEAGAQALSDVTARGINLVANAAARSADHVTSYFTMLQTELAFYVSCLSLHDQLTARDVPVTFPEPVFDQPTADHPAGGEKAGGEKAGGWSADGLPPWPQLSCTDLRDASLALRIDRVVGNDIDAVGKPLVIITGASSGGKSTFLRSVGVAQLMMQAGLFVTAQSFRSSICRQVFTHFIREEDASMVSGRLDEELARMSVIADRLSPNCLVLFNESFAATNEREGSEIGRQVVRALLQAGVRVCFVTHQFDFADSFYRQQPDSTVCLRAPRQPDGQRTFRLEVAEPLPTSFGQDIYYRIGGWLGEQEARNVWDSQR